MAIKTKPWDPAERLRTPEAEFAYLEAAFEDGDPAVIAAAFGDIARVRGMTKVANGAGLSRETMYKALSADGNPTMETISKIARELGYRLTIARAARGRPSGKNRTGRPQIRPPGKAA